MKGSITHLLEKLVVFEEMSIQTPRTDDDLDLVDHVHHADHIDHLDHTDHIDHIDHLDHNVDHLTADPVSAVMISI